MNKKLIPFFTIITVLFFCLFTCLSTCGKKPLTQNRSVVEEREEKGEKQDPLEEIEKQRARFREDSIIAARKRETDSINASQQLVIDSIFSCSEDSISAESKYSLFEWSQTQIDKANTAQNEEYLTTQEKIVILLCNLARMDGNWFSKVVVEPYLDGRTNSYIKSLYNDLKNTKNLEMLYPDKGLTAAAEYHAKDMGKTGKVSHKSSDGTDFSSRVHKWCPDYSYIGENCSYGFNEAIDIVMQLLVDDGIESLGHRKNVLNPDFRKVGVSIQPHTVYRFNCVQDFAD